MEKDYLRERGWDYTSNNPGSVWLWEKTDKRGRVYRCNLKTALHLQEDLHDEPAELIVTHNVEASEKGYVVYADGFPCWLPANDPATAQEDAKEVLGLPADAPDLPIYDSSDDPNA